MPTTVTVDSTKWEEAQRLAFQAALDESADVARTLAPRDHGDYAASLASVTSVTSTGAKGAVGSNSPHAGALEHGANVGKRRGPHMRGQHILARAMAGFGVRLAAHLRSAR